MKLRKERLHKGGGKQNQGWKRTVCLAWGAAEGLQREPGHHPRPPVLCISCSPELYYSLLKIKTDKQLFPGRPFHILMYSWVVPKPDDYSK